ncbi:hypothetical protein [Desulfosarcina sp.]|uniref:hypothetical protein n=1 Tax=Desulfosarcina sp. TaxID=2027861 RepID=UPI003561F344
MKNSKTIIIDPVWDELEKVRNQLGRFLIDQHLSEFQNHAATMVFNELIEKGIKYGKFGPGDQIESHITIDDRMITIEVVTPVDETNHIHLQELDEMIQWIRGYQDPFEAYIEKLKKVARLPIDDKKSGLGLVRIAYEGGAILDFCNIEDGRLNVTAVLNF